MRRRAPKDNFYEDRDGKSTPEAIASFSNKRHKGTILVFSLICFGTSTAVSALTSINHGRGESLEAWLVTASWVSN